MVKLSGKRTLIFVLSVGWVIPGFLGLVSLEEWVKVQLLPQIRGEGLMSSFPHLDAGFILLKLSLGWLVLVVSGWVVAFMNGSERNDS